MGGGEEKNSVWFSEANKNIWKFNDLIFLICPFYYKVIFSFLFCYSRQLRDENEEKNDNEEKNVLSKYKKLSPKIGKSDLT
jgi:hypothetical protein